MQSSLIIQNCKKKCIYPFPTLSIYAKLNATNLGGIRTLSSISVSESLTVILPDVFFPHPLFLENSNPPRRNHYLKLSAMIDKNHNHKLKLKWKSHCHSIFSICNILRRRKSMIACTRCDV